MKNFLLTLQLELLDIYLQKITLLIKLFNTIKDQLEAKKVNNNYISIDETSVELFSKPNNSVIVIIFVCQECLFIVYF